MLNSNLPCILRDSWLLQQSTVKQQWKSKLIQMWEYQELQLFLQTLTGLIMTETFWKNKTKNKNTLWIIVTEHWQCLPREIIAHLQHIWCEDLSPKSSTASQLEGLTPTINVLLFNYSNHCAVSFREWLIKPNCSTEIHKARQVKR